MSEKHFEKQSQSHSQIRNKVLSSFFIFKINILKSSRYIKSILKK